MEYDVSLRTTGGNHSDITRFAKFVRISPLKHHEKYVTKKTKRPFICMCIPSAPKVAMSSKPLCLGGHSQKLNEINIIPGCTPKMEANKNWRYPISCAPPPILLTFKKNKRGATSTSFHKLRSSDLNWENNLDRLDFLETVRRIRHEGYFPRLHMNMSKTEQLDTQSDWRCLKLNAEYLIRLQ